MSPVAPSYATSVTGWSPRFDVRSVHVAVPVPGLKRTSKTWPGWPGVYAAYPVNDTIAWNLSAGSTEMPLTKRVGCAGVSIRVYVTAEAGSAFAFCVTNTRPRRGAAPPRPGSRDGPGLAARDPAVRPPLFPG